MNFVLASKTLARLLNGVPIKKCELLVNFRFIYFNILFYKTRLWFHHSHCMYGVFFKMLRQEIKANNKTSLYKRPSYCNFFRELYARYFPKEDDSV